VTPSTDSNVLAVVMLTVMGLSPVSERSQIARHEASKNARMAAGVMPLLAGQNDYICVGLDGHSMSQSSLIHLTLPAFCFQLSGNLGDDQPVFGAHALAQG
jgi:hypothetical protein